MITPEEARQIADRWVAGSAPPGRDLTATVHDFDLGYVVWGVPPPAARPLFGAGRGIIDRKTGELSVWPSLPIEGVMAEYRARRPPQPHTWDPAEQARRDLRRVRTPATVTHLTLADDALTARSVKGDIEPVHHRLVREFQTVELAAEFRERGYQRCAEAAALSDALHAADAGRGTPITLAQARADLFAGASLVSYRVREDGDPIGGQPASPCLSCALLCRHFGFAVDLPEGADQSPTDVASVLTEAGWAPGRRADEATAEVLALIGEQLGRHGARIDAFDAAVQALTEFGGLYVAQNGVGVDVRRRPFAIDPSLVTASCETLGDFGRVISSGLFPLGMEGEHESILAIDEYGRVFALDHAGEWHLGDSPNAALSTLISGTAPARVDDHGSW